MNILRRLPLSRLLALCALGLAIAASAAAIALAMGAGPTPPAKPLAQAIHDALAEGRAAPVQGVSASITYTDHLLEGASLASGGHEGEWTSSPLLAGASGRLWLASDGDLRIELQSQQGDTQILYDGRTLELYNAATNTLYRYTPPASEPSTHTHEVPTVAKIEEAVSHLSRHADVSGATPTDVAGQPAYSVRVSPNEGGSLFGGVELAWDASNGVPLRAAIYSSTSSSPVIELAATEISYGPVAASVFELNPPANAKVEEVSANDSVDAHATHKAPDGKGRPKITSHGSGPTSIAVLASSRYGESEEEAGAKAGTSQSLEGLPKVSINGASASELRTELGTVLSFERGGVRYLLAGSVDPAAVEALARSL